MNYTDYTLCQKPASFEGEDYFPVMPSCADSDELAQQGRRLMIRHSRHGLSTFIAPTTEIHAGWVIGLFPTAA